MRACYSIQADIGDLSNPEAVMRERMGIALLFTVILLSLSEVSPFPFTAAWLWIADRLINWILFYELIPPDSAELVSLIASSVSMFCFAFLFSLAFVLDAERRAEA